MLDPNKILIIVIVILIGVILVFGVYFLIVFLNNRNHEKKFDSLFGSNTGVEEKSLMNDMDEKKNVYSNIGLKIKNRLQNTDNNGYDNSTVSTYTPPSGPRMNNNPFGIDLTPRDKTGEKKNIENSQNKFIK